MPINMTHRVTELDVARRKLLLTRARENASAAQDCLAQDLRARAEALAVTIA